MNLGRLFLLVILPAMALATEAEQPDPKPYRPEELPDLNDLVTLRDQSWRTGVVYGPKAAYMIKAPEGWVLDNQSGQSQGLPCVLYPEAFNYDETQVEMYAKIAAPEYPKAEEFAAWAIDQMKQQAQGLQYTRIENGKTNEGYSYFINEYRRERGYDRVERAAYVQLPDAVAYVVLTAVGEGLFAEHKGALNGAVQSLTYMPDFIGFDGSAQNALQKQE